MLTVLMLARWPRSLFVLSVGAACLLATACEKVPLLAPTGSTITLTAGTTALSANGTTSIIAQVLEAAGTPPHSGTHVTFTTTIGRIEPAQVTTDVGGRVTVTFHAGGSNGTATISAISGGATTGTTGALKIAVGTAAVGRVSVNANPASVPALGGSTTVTASVIDVNGNPLVGAPVSFTTTAGTLSSGTVATDTNGASATTLTTSTQAIVTATVGAQGSTSTGTGTSTGTSTATGQASGSVTVTVSSAPSIAISAPSTAPTKGQPAFFTFTVTAAQNGSQVRDVTVNWGDGVVQSLGSFTGASSSSHVYRSDGGFLVVATVVDAAGSSNSASAAITVLPASGPTVVITPPLSISRGLPSVFTFTVTPATGSGTTIRSLTVNWGDGTVQDLGGISGASSQAHTFATEGTFLVTATATDATGTSTTVSTSVIVLALARPTIVVSASPLSQSVGGTVTFTVSVTMPTGLGLQSTSIDFGDGSSQQLGGATSATITKSYTSAGAKSVVVTVVDTTGRSSTGTTSVTITP